jgi:hypothetical protein
MGLFSKGDKVRGWAQIVSTSQAPYQASIASCKMQVIVQAEGIPATPVETTKMCSARKWPSPGMTVPCLIDPQKPEKFKILWDEIESWEEQARGQAAAMAEQMNRQAGQPGMAPGQMGGGAVQIVNLSGGAADPAKIAQLEQMLGRDLDGDGSIGMIGGSGPVTGSSSPLPGTDVDDRVGSLERLAALRDKGLLTPAEFDAEKRRILGG